MIRVTRVNEQVAWRSGRKKKWAMEWDSDIETSTLHCKHCRLSQTRWLYYQKKHCLFICLSSVLKLVFTIWNSFRFIDSTRFLSAKNAETIKEFQFIDGWRQFHIIIHSSIAFHTNAFLTFSHHHQYFVHIGRNRSAECHPTTTASTTTELGAKCTQTQRNRMKLRHRGRTTCTILRSCSIASIQCSKHWQSVHFVCLRRWVHFLHWFCLFPRIEEHTNETIK